MMNNAQIFYVLNPQADPHYGEYIYGKKEWGPRYGLAEWAADVDLEQITCPKHTFLHQRAGNRIGQLKVLLSPRKLADFIWTWHHECLVKEEIYERFQAEGFTGITSKEIEIIRAKSSKELPEGLRYVELVVTGNGGEASPLSGIKIIKECQACNLKNYSPFTNGIIVDENNWDGSDFFTVNGYSKFILITERVKNLIIENNWTNCAIIRSDEIKWPN